MSSAASYDDAVAVDSDVDIEMIDRDDVSNYNPDQILPEPPADIQKIRSWLEPTSYDNVGGEFRKHQAAHVDGTGVWLTSSSTYQQWLQGEEHGLLWIKGIPGSGKSVMAANLIHEITASNPGCPVLFFFFRQIIQANHDPQALLRDWMDQVLDYSPPLQKRLMTYLSRSIDSISMEDMWNDLKMALANLPDKAFCIADALDEMDQGNDAFLTSLGDLGSWRPKTVKVLITSRPVPAVEDPLRLTPCLHLRLEEEMVDADISTYVQYTLSNSAIPQSDWEVIKKAVPGRANGLFLYAKLAMDAFLEEGADITQVIARLPADLNVLYTELLKEHACRSGIAEEIQHLILQAVTHASRPLRLLELAEMIKVLNPDGSARDLKATKSLIRAACGPLLEILADETVSVVHHSFTEYLKGTTRSEDDPGYPILRRGPTHAVLATSCLHYLQAGGLNSVAEDSKRKYAWHEPESNRPLGLESRLKHPFFDYAVNNWAHHANRSEAAGYDQTALSVEIAKFLGDDDNRRRWLQMESPAYESLTLLHIAAKEGLVSYTKELLKTSEVDICSDYGQTPLWMAAVNGHSEVVRVLITAGADPNPREPDEGMKPLQEAATRNHSEVVRALLEAGIDPRAFTKTTSADEECCDDNSDFYEYPASEDTALRFACNNGHLETIEVFLSFIDNVDTVHRALALAAESSAWKVVARLLQVPGVDVNIIVDGNTPLFQACEYPRDLETVKMLLDAGADPNVKCRGTRADYPESLSYPETPETPETPTPMFNCLHQICRPEISVTTNSAGGRAGCFSTVFSLLVEAGADVHQRTATGQTLLHRTGRSPVLARLLLDAGVDANATDEDGFTPLHVVESQDVMSLLIEHGHANINARARSGRTPLLHMLDAPIVANSYYGSNIDRLIEYGPDCTVADNKGNGALHLALPRWSTSDRIKALLAAGADPNLRNQEGLTPLASLDDRFTRISETLDLLVDAGADINAVDRDGATFLFILLSSRRSVAYEFYQTIQHLVDRGASIFARDRKGRTLLHEVVRHQNARHLPSGRSFVRHLDSLLSRGLNLEVVDHGGNGLLHELALRKENSITISSNIMVYLWEQLVARGLDPDAKNNAGRTPLHILCAPGANPTPPGDFCNNTGVGHKNDEFDPRSFMPIDYVISKTKNVDCVDLDGITPLHVAAAGDEFCANRLIAAGADPGIATYEGLTPLHVAARCRESNIVGCLLNALRKRHGTTKPVTGANARTFDRAGVTPLFYACQSGRPETVALLLDAGADVKIGSPFTACLGFEREDQLWRNPHPSTEPPENGMGVAAVKLHDTYRRVPQGHGLHGLTEQKTPRLEEILDLLIKHGAELHRDGDGDAMMSIRHAVGDDEHYLAACLKDALTEHDKLPRPRYEDPVAKWATCLQPLTNEASVRIMKDLKLPEAGESNVELVCYLLARKKYSLVEQLAHMGANFLPTRDKVLGLRSSMSVLIRHGFSRLVDRIGTLEAESKLEKGDWHAFGDRKRPGLWYAGNDFNTPEKRFDTIEPFIIEAVQRKLPNMDVVRLLVEKFGVDVNQPSCPSPGARDSAKASALHHAALGQAWWHVHQALPYLLGAGADINIRNSRGQTPLLVSLASTGEYRLYGPYCMEATKMLIEAGADVNASDSQGRSCLALAHRDMDLVRLLMAHGATVTADVLFTVIGGRNIEGLKEILSGQVDANMRLPKKPDETKEERAHHRGEWRQVRTVEHEEYPLCAAAGKMTNRSISRLGSLGQQRAEDVFLTMQLLLDHGADPLARLWQVEERSEEPGVESHVETTVLHRMLRTGWLVGPILSVPGLDINCRDSKGRALLHAACEGAEGPDYGVLCRKGDTYQADDMSIFKKLLSLGADLEARDDFGRNVLHHMIPDDGYLDKFSQFQDSLAHVLDKAPSLVNQADGDGWTPLYYAVRGGCRIKNLHVAKALLSAGADLLVIAANGESLLHVLATYLEVEEVLDMFEELVGRGLDANKRNEMGDTPLFAFYSRRDSRELFRESTRDYSGSDDGLSIASESDHNEEARRDGILREREAAKMLKRVGADFFARDAKGRGLLHLAASRNVECFSDLMELGLDAMLEDDAQQTPLDVAAAFENESVLQLFEKDKKECTF
ncbi:hypothetical protein ACJ41O_009986 [Fusarium nematophilum]